MDYIKSEKQPGCIFCDMLDSDDDEGMLILKRGEKSFIVMNKYPYTNGHLMVAPYRHTCDLVGLTTEEHTEIFMFVQQCVTALKGMMDPHGFNIGMNLGLVAGAGVEDHLHFHIVPRWNGDNNFMPVLSDCRVINEHIGETYLQLKDQFGKIK
jgi:ATP adenylyltransferase